jgi:hypothetical protein
MRRPEEFKCPRCGHNNPIFTALATYISHEWLVPGLGKEAAKVLPWVHTLIANIKGNIRGVYHGGSRKHLHRYLKEFCYASTVVSGNRKC